jgi:ABC-type glycerol-3-phosphate transport system permease component
MTSVPAPGRSAAGRSVGSARRLTRSTRKTVLNLLGLLVALFALFPVLWMISTAFKPPTEIYSLTPQPIPLHPTLANFRTVFSGSVIGMPYWTFLRNSLFVTLVAVALSSLLGLLAAIALGRFKFRFRTTYLVVLLIVQLLPQQALVVSLFIDFRKLNLLDSLVGLIVVYTAFALPVTVWMLRNFAATVPKDIEEAAAIDGAGAWTRFWKILLPLISPGLVSTSVFAFIFAYNEFVFALTFLSTDTSKFTLPLYVQYFYGQNSTNWGAIMASSTLFTIPVLAFFLLTQRRLASGLVAGAVKG